MESKKYKELKDKLLKLNESRNELIEARQKLLENDIVKQYVALDDELSETNLEYRRLYRDLIREKQNTCSHPVWYFMDGFTDRYEGRAYWSCKCVACGKEIREMRSRNYPNDRVIWKDCYFADPTPSEYSYEDIASKWVEYLQKDQDEEQNLEEKGRAFTKKMNPKFESNQ